MMKHLRSLFGGKPPAPANPKELFAAEVELFLRSAAGVKSVTRAPGDFAFEVVTSAGTRRVFLDNAFVESREMSPEQRREKIAFFFAAVGADEQNESWDAARETFVPVLRGATYGMDLWMKQPAAAFVRRPFLPHVDIIVAMDRASKSTTRRTVLSGSSRRTTRTSPPASSCPAGSPPSAAGSRGTPSRSPPSARPSWWEATAAPR
jgi:hypothetical protein